MRAKTSPAHFGYTGLLPIEPRDDFFWPIALKPEPIDLNPEPIDLRRKLSKKIQSSSEV
jgi:hypothetical protein